MKWRPAWDILKHAGRKFSHDRGSRLSAALAFHVALSIAPLLLAVIGIVSLTFGKEAARGELAHELHHVIGGESARIIQSMLANDPTNGGILATILGFLILIVGALGAFASLQDALNTMWAEQTGQPSHSVWHTLRNEFISIAMIVVMAFLLMASLIFTAVVDLVKPTLQGWLPVSTFSMHVLNAAITFVLTGLMFVAIFRFLPNNRPPWAAVWRGALVTAAFVSIGKSLIGWYLGFASLSSIYGAAGSFIALLFWLYYTSIIVLYGSEITNILAVGYAAEKTAKAQRLMMATA